jgi:hypothetical protein
MELNQNLLTFDEERHLYFYDGKEIPSITQIVAPKIDGSFEVVKKAAQEGTLIHKAVEKFLKGIISITDEH